MELLSIRAISCSESHRHVKGLSVNGYVMQVNQNASGMKCIVNLLLRFFALTFAD
jgi:hypothetical protein